MKPFALIALLVSGVFLSACENQNKDAALRPDESYSPTASSSDTGGTGSLDSLDATGDPMYAGSSSTYTTTGGTPTTYDPVYPVEYKPAPTDDEVLTPAGSATGRTHVVQKGDTLYSLARQYYADQKRWRDIYNANRARISDPNSIKVGTKLIIP